MYYKCGSLHFSPSDRITYLGSPFASWMDRLAIEVSYGAFNPDAEDPLLATLQGRGYAHEAKLLANVQASHQHVVEIEAGSRKSAASQTIESLQSGAEIVFQGYLSLPPFAGYADFLVRASRPGPADWQAPSPGPRRAARRCRGRLPRSPR